MKSFIFFHLGTRAALPNVVRQMCWPHADRAMKRKLSKCHLKEELLADIHLLQQANTPNVFDRAAYLML